MLGSSKEWGLCAVVELDTALYMNSRLLLQFQVDSVRRTSPNVPATRASMAVHALTTSMGSLASALWAASETCVFTISATVIIRLVSTMPRVSWMTRAWLDATVRAGTKAKFANEISVPTSRAKTGRARMDNASVYPGTEVLVAKWISARSVWMGRRVEMGLVSARRDSWILTVRIR